MTAKIPKDLSDRPRKYLTEGLAVMAFTVTTAETKADLLARIERLYQKPVELCTRQELVEFVSAAKNPRTLYNRFTVLKAYLRWISAEFPVSIATLKTFRGAPIKFTQPDLPCWSLDEIDRIFSTAVSFGRTKDLARRNYLMVSFAYWLCLRCATISSIRVEDVQFDSGSIYLSVLKGGKMDDTPIPESAAALLADYILNFRPRIVRNHEDQGYLFPSTHGGKLNGSSVYEIVRDIVKASGLDRTKYIGPHGFRHAAATHYSQNGVAPAILQIIMFHANMDTTGRYIKHDQEDVRKVLDKPTGFGYMHGGNTIKKFVRDFSRMQAAKKGV